MVIKKYVCDRCKAEIDEPYVYRITIEKTDKDKIDDMGAAEPCLIDADFCTSCRTEILGFIKCKAEQPTEVVQESLPRTRKPRTKGDDLANDKQIARAMRNAGKSIGEIARALDHSYQCIKNWCE